MANKVTKAQLNKHLQSLEKEDLIKEIGKLYTKFSDVKQFYQIELTDDTTDIVEEYKKKIKAEYFPTRGYGKARNSVSRKVINDFKKISVFQVDVIELLLYRVEMMLEFTMAYGDIDEPFYTSMESSFDDACKLIAKEGLQKEYFPRCQECLKVAYNFGWGTYDIFEQSIEEYLR